MNHVIPEHAFFRPGTVDREIWHEVVERNSYRLPDLFHYRDVVLDVGAHTGSASWRCANAGARVIALEPSADNLPLLLRNTDPVRERVTVVGCAAWRSDRPAEFLPFRSSWQPCNTGGGNVLGHPGCRGYDVWGLPLDDLLRPHERVRLLKLDCEGAEFPALYTAALLDRVAEIAGEYHDHPELAPAGDPPWQMASLKTHLEGRGFAVEVKPAPDNAAMGYFWARR